MLSLQAERRHLRGAMGVAGEDCLVAVFVAMMLGLGFDIAELGVGRC